MNENIADVVRIAGYEVEEIRLESDEMTISTNGCILSEAFRRTAALITRAVNTHSGRSPRLRIMDKDIACIVRITRHKIRSGGGESDDMTIGTDDGKIAQIISLSTSTIHARTCRDTSLHIVNEHIRLIISIS